MMTALLLHGFDLTSFLLFLLIAIIGLAVVLACLIVPIIFYIRGLLELRRRKVVSEDPE